ncbi:MAG: hypothetical protein EON94_14685 [Caulobacteraceae bacterium]|nr:MAG: hypothetical protein EON94_14685 [Caulobacteraceae bacterium]
MPAQKRSTPEEDLAYMREIAEGGTPRASYTAGMVYLSSGLLYGVQCLFHIGQIVGVVRVPGWVSLTFVIGILVATIGCMVWATLRDRREGLKAFGNTKAMSAALSATGLANCAFLIIFAVNAVRMENFAIWLLYPAVVFAVQGAAWFIAWQLKRHVWMLLTSIGGMITAVALGLLIHDSFAYLCVCTAALFLLFALPGWIMIRDAHAWSTRSARIGLA